MTNVEAETRRRQTQVLQSEGFSEAFAKCLAEIASKARLTRSRDLKRKYKRKGWKA